MIADYTIHTIQEAARRIWDKIGEGRVVAIQGEMGSGKTTLVHALCDVRGVKDAVGSPTYSLINEYVYSSPLGEEKLIFHLDLYRLRDEEEALAAGIEECFYSGATCFVEWPEKIPALLPEDVITISILVTGTGTRQLQLLDPLD
jgi:tRNA threonylcarbamoyladenosine biosynthesis protein TsaE